ncbi:4-oxalomesaconate tautomerase [Paracoccus sp. (in: a-proteobacteria)]|uniref:4-oxalomesaconate tautomerase n=1 Tax=Paracoccus sp. TaxID=267 RepID=UPI0026E04B91|nr:4-oxalomesaconate tautomerase [Paracoccus sp. (in: a-proteobacteria)]MDO5648299.1 4-oxalomesaconate tautomerase [Paracoccus sp. (in: a-proteobacteria)]
MAQQHDIPVMVMRGGTSKGPFFRMSDLPDDPAARDRLLLAVMGSPDARQIDGIGGGDSLTSKVAMVAPSTRDGVDVDFLFAQVSVTDAVVDTGPSCGNILSGVGPFAIETGMVAVTGRETRVVIHNLNTNSRIEAIVQTDKGGVIYDGDTAIAGVPGTAAPVRLNFMDIVGSKTGALLPTGHLRETINGVDVTLIDVAVPMMIFRAEDVGKTGFETPADLDADRDFFARIEAMRIIAGQRMGLGDVSRRVIPRMAMLAAPRDGGHIAARYFVPHKTHAAFAVTGALCVSTVAMLAGSVSDGLAQRPDGDDRVILIEHPSGMIDIALRTTGQGAELQIVSGGAIRTARKLLAGSVFVPAAVLG